MSEWEVCWNPLIGRVSERFSACDSRTHSFLQELLCSNKKYEATLKTFATTLVHLKLLRRVKLAEEWEPIWLRKKLLTPMFGHWHAEMVLRWARKRASSANRNWKRLQKVKINKNTLFLERSAKLNLDPKIWRRRRNLLKEKMMFVGRK